MPAKIQTITRLISNGATHKLGKLLKDRDMEVNHLDQQSGRTPLMVACEYEQYDVAKLFIEHGADTNTPGYADWTALHFAVDSAINTETTPKKGKKTGDAPVELIVYLLWKGAKVSAQTASGQTSLDLARAAKNDKLVNLLEHYA